MNLGNQLEGHCKSMGERWLLWTSNGGKENEGKFMGVGGRKWNPQYSVIG